MKFIKRAKIGLYIYLQAFYLRQESPQSNEKIGEPEKKVQRKSEEIDNGGKRDAQTNRKNSDTKEVSPKASKTSPKNICSSFKKQISDVKKEITNENEKLDNKPLTAEIESEPKSSKDATSRIHCDSNQNSSKDDRANIKKLSVEANQCGAEYNPASTKYHPIKDAYWKANQR